MTAIDDGHNFFNPRMILANGTAEDVSSSAMDCFTAIPSTSANRRGRHHSDR
jgi:hypothetical protein